MGTVVCCKCEKFKGTSIEDHIKALNDEEEYIKSEIQDEVKNNKIYQRKPTDEIKMNVRLSTVLSLLSELEFHLRETFIYVEDENRTALEDDYMRKMQEVWDKYYSAKNRDYSEVVCI